MDLKLELHRKLQIAREHVLSRLDGLSEYDLRRPLTPSGTNLLGLMKHLASGEFRYLGDSFGRSPEPQLPWVLDGSDWESADMWASAEQSSEYIVGLYRQAWAHGDETIATLDLDAPGRVPHWPEGRRDTTLGVLLIRVLAETSHHAGHADVVREMIDGRGGPDHDEIGGADWWERYVARIQSAADTFRAD